MPRSSALTVSGRCSLPSLSVIRICVAIVVSPR
jgi:hypothetical protein